MDLLVASGVEKAWGDRHILRGADLVVHPGECIGLVGPNGCGKSTFLQILAGEMEPDHGTVLRSSQPGYLGQDPQLSGGTVREVAAGALSWHKELLAAWSAAVEGDGRAAAELHGRLDLVGWTLEHQIDNVLSRLRAPPGDARVETLSGGERRRVALARALLSSPDLLLLDEPTNHLDAETVAWLEAFLTGFRGGVVLVTHDRYLLESVATRIVEVEDGVTVSYDGSYGDWLIARAERQAALHKAEDTRLALIEREAAWAARSPAARTTKQKARLDRLAALQSVRGLQQQKSFSFDLRTGTKFGRTFLEARGLRKGWGGRVVVNQLDLDLGPGDRIGIVGANGAGKSTLLGMLAGTITPDAGRITRGPRVRTAVLDQARTGLDLGSTVFEAAADGNDTVTVGEEPVHVAGFLRRFLFGREMLDQRVSGLSGGERARLLLARLMLQGSNLLLLDEPTNDLDLMTLSVLEEALMGFDGAAVIVTHDRAFLDRVCTAVLAFHGDGRIVRYASRQQWLDALAEESTPKAVAVAPRAVRAASTRLSYKEQQELAGLPARIEKLEAERAQVEERLADPAVYRTGDALVLRRRLEALGPEIDGAYARWEELDGR